MHEPKKTPIKAVEDFLNVELDGTTRSTLVEMIISAKFVSKMFLSLQLCTHSGQEERD